MLVFFIFLFAGFFAAASTIASDICVNPSAALASIGNLHNPSGQAISDMTFMVTCTNTGVDHVNRMSAVTNDLNEAMSAMNSAVNNAQPSGLYTGFPALLRVPAFSQIELQWAQSSVSLIAPLDDCYPMTGYNNDIMQPLCAVATVGIIELWALATAACVLVYIMASAGARMMWKHEGDPAEAEHKSEELPK